MSDDKILGYAISWRTRDGSEMRMSWGVNPDSISRGGPIPTPETAEYVDVVECRASAREMGWPGHDGAWWRYWLDDIRAWWSRVTAPRQQARP